MMCMTYDAIIFPSRCLPSITYIKLLPEANAYPVWGHWLWRIFIISLRALTFRACGMQAVCHASPIVRSAAQAGLCELPHPIYEALEAAQQAQICNWIWHACQHDSAAAVRAAAAKCLGHVVEGMTLQGCPSGTHGMMICKPNFAPMSLLQSCVCCTHVSAAPTCFVHIMQHCAVTVQLASSLVHLHLCRTLCPAVNMTCWPTML